MHVQTRNPHSTRCFLLCTLLPCTLLLCTLLLSACGGRQFTPRLEVSPLSDAEQNAQTTTWLDAIRTQGRPGDWLVVRGYKGTDNFIVSVTGIPLSHAAILDPERDLVIESQTPGVIETPLQDFLNHSHRVLLIRPRWWSDTVGPASLQKARDLVGHSYDFTGLVGLDDEERFYCTELAFHIYKDQQVPRDRLPLVIEPGQMYLWGTILWDSGERD
jgi:hypothetical protein